MSRAAAETLRSYGYHGRIEIVQHGTDMPNIRAVDIQAARGMFALSNGPILLYVGQLDWKKNLRQTLNAAALLQSRGVSFQLVLAGQGKDEAAIRKLAQELGVNACFTGHITDPRLLNGLYAAASLFVFPSAYDTAGLVVREAAAAGTPSVVLQTARPRRWCETEKTALSAAKRPKACAMSCKGRFRNPAASRAWANRRACAYLYLGGM